MPRGPGHWRTWPEVMSFGPQGQPPSTRQLALGPWTLGRHLGGPVTTNARHHPPDAEGPLDPRLGTALNYPRPKPPPDSSAPRRGRRSRRAPGWSRVLGGEPGAEGYIYAKVPRLTPKRPRAEGGRGWGTGGLSVGDAKGSGRRRGTERWLVTAARASSPGGGDPPAQDERGTCSPLPPAASRGLRRLSVERGP